LHQQKENVGQMAGTILFGIDVESASESTVGFVRYGLPLFESLQVPVTWYVTGKTLEKYPDLFREADRHPLIDLQAHTYNHVLLKTIWLKVPPGKEIHGSRDYFVKRGEPPDVVNADLAKCQGVFEEVLGRRALGLTTPWGYYRGLGDRPDLLEIVWNHGFRFLRSFARNETDGQPVLLDWQPFSYACHGYADMVELLLHDYQDDFYWEAFSDHGPHETYADHMMGMVDKVVEENLVWSAASHDHGTATEEGFKKKGDWYRAFLSYGLEKGVRFLTGAQFYREFLAQAARGERPCTP